MRKSASERAPVSLRSVETSRFVFLIGASAFNNEMEKATRAMDQEPGSENREANRRAWNIRRRPLP